MVIQQSFTIFVATLFSFGVAVASPVHHESNDRSPQSKVRLSHAKELLGGTYRKSVVRISENIKDVSDFMEGTIKKFLPKASRQVSKKLSKAILKAADDYEFDPIFLVAVIQNESSFNPKLRGSAGEIGLMQIKPSTAAWIAGQYHLPYKNAKSLYDPLINVRIGAALMSKLRDQFDAQSRLYLSAYNIGAKKVRSLVEGKKIPKDYVVAVMKRYIAIYSAFKVKGTDAERSEVAFNHTRDLTRKQVATN